MHNRKAQVNNINDDITFNRQLNNIIHLTDASPRPQLELNHRMWYSQRPLSKCVKFY